jgi:hypothetical protein
VLVAGPDFILPVHLAKRPCSKQHHARKLLRSLETGGRQVVLLAFLHNFVDATAALLTHIQLAHGSGQQFIAAARGVVDEAALFNQGLARVGSFDAVVEHIMYCGETPWARKAWLIRALAMSSRSHQKIRCVESILTYPVLPRAG